MRIVSEESRSTSCKIGTRSPTESDRLAENEPDRNQAAPRSAATVDGCHQGTQPVDGQAPDSSGRSLIELPAFRARVGMKDDDCIERREGFLRKIELD